MTQYRPPTSTMTPQQIAMQATPDVPRPAKMPHVVAAAAALLVAALFGLALAAKDPQHSTAVGLWVAYPLGIMMFASILIIPATIGSYFVRLSMWKGRSGYNAARRSALTGMVQEGREAGMDVYATQQARDPYLARWAAAQQAGDTLGAQQALDAAVAAGLPVNETIIKEYVGRMMRQERQRQRASAA